MENKKLIEEIKKFRKLTGLLTEDIASTSAGGPTGWMVNLLGVLRRIGLDQTNYAIIEGLERSGKIVTDLNTTTGQRFFNTINWNSLTNTEVDDLFKINAVADAFEQFASSNRLDLMNDVVVNNLTGKWGMLAKRWKARGSLSNTPTPNNPPLFNSGPSVVTSPLKKLVTNEKSSFWLDLETKLKNEDFVKKNYNKFFDSNGDMLIDVKALFRSTISKILNDIDTMTPEQAYLRVYENASPDIQRIIKNAGGENWFKGLFRIYPKTMWTLTAWTVLGFPISNLTGVNLTIWNVLWQVLKNIVLGLLMGAGAIKPETPDWWLKLQKNWNEDKKPETNITNPGGDEYEVIIDPATGEPQKVKKN